MLTVVELLARLKERKQTLQEEVFSSPPKTMEEFQKRLGQWIELNDQIKDLTVIVKGIEEESP